VYASGLGPGAVVETALRKRAEGYRAFKLKVGFGPARDTANLRALREALGDGVPIMTDANQAWTETEAIARIAELAPFAPRWIEEPIAADEPAAAWQRVAKASPIPLAAGENLRGHDAFTQAIDGGWLGFVQPDVGKWGGVTRCREIAAHAARRGIACCPHWLGGGIGLAASLHFVAAFGTAGSCAEVDANPNPLREAVCHLRPRDGEIVLGDAPGLGVEPDLVRLKPFAVAW
jgi:L-alanine-DL-glutamate epimerase-like enolase superfamily enzyme